MSIRQRPSLSTLFCGRCARELNVTGWVGFAWGTEILLRNSQGPSYNLESQVFSSISIEFPLVLMTHICGLNVSAWMTPSGAPCGGGARLYWRAQFQAHLVLPVSRGSALLVLLQYSPKNLTCSLCYAPAQYEFAVGFAWAAGHSIPYCHCSYNGVRKDWH